MSILDKIKNAVQSAGESAPAFDPSTLNDTLAMTTAWDPANTGGANFCTHHLEVISPNRVEYRMRRITLLLPGMLIFFGLALAIASPIGAFLNSILLPLLGIPMGVALLLVGFSVLHSWTTPQVFDRTAGHYWKGKIDDVHLDLQDTKEKCLLNDIHAIQILSEYCLGKESSSYHSYEINLVLNDGERINLVDHADKAAICSEAETLSGFLNVPIWNAT
jgi:hypothetical protein